MDKWEFYKDASGEWRWRRVASNGRIVGSSCQGYVNKSDCLENAKRDMATDKWEFYKDASGEWRWRVIASNGRIVGASSQGYVNRSGCLENAERFKYQY